MIGHPRFSLWDWIPSFSIQATLSVGYCRQRWMRVLLILASIALGVATLVATRALNHNLNLAAQSSVNPLSGLADLLIVNGQSGVPRKLIERINRARVQPQVSAATSLALLAGPLSLAPLLAAATLLPPPPGYPPLKEIQPLVIGRVVIPELDNRSVLLLGIQRPSSQDLAALQRGESGAGLPPGLKIQRLGSDLDLLAALALGQTPAILSAELARDLGRKAGPTVQPGGAGAPLFCHARLAGRQRALMVPATFEITSDALNMDPNVIFMEAEAAAWLNFPLRPDFVSQITINLEPGQDREQTRRQLKEALGGPYRVETVAATREIIRDVTAGLELGFAIGGAGALVVGLFLVFNALSVSVAERRHDIGILRSVGATRLQVAGLFVNEALVLGVVGSLLGLPLGLLLTQVALGPFSQLMSDFFVPLKKPDLTLSGDTLLLALGAGVATTILAALVPALQASREEPADVVRRVPTALHLIYKIAQLAGSGLLLLIGLLCVLFRDYLPLRVGTFAGIVCLVLCALVATPLLSTLIGRFLNPLFRLFLGLEGRLAADNLARSPGRTGLVIAALAATGGLMVQTAGFIQSSKTALLSWLEEEIAADVFVTAGASITEASKTLPMSENLARELAALPDVEVALPVRFHFLNYHRRIVLMVAMDAQAFHDTQQAHQLARNLKDYPRLRQPGTALVSRNFAALHQVRVGDHIRLEGLDGPLQVEIIGTVVDYTWNRGTIIVDRGWFRDHYLDNMVDIYDIYLKHPSGLALTPEMRQAAARRIQDKLNQQEGVYAVAREEFRESISNQLSRVYSLAYAQQAVVGLVALLGVVGALLISVLQRRRELGLLRAVGASRGQVLRSVLAEAVLMGMVGAVLGLLIGLMLEWYVIDVVVLDESGFTFPILIPWAIAGVVMGLSVLLATLVGLWPAYQATRIRIAEAIAYE